MRSRPRFIISKERVLSQYHEVKGICESVSYSFKTNSEVGLILRDVTDCMFSIHARASIDILGCPDRIWFFAQGWDQEEVSLIIRQGVRRFVVDNENDLLALLGSLEGETALGSVELLLRMRLKERTIHTGKHFVFGFYSEQIKRWIPKLRAHPRISVLGIHFHKKTQNVSEWSLKYELGSLFDEDIFDAIDVVNIGGGIPAVYRNSRAGSVESVLMKIQEFHDWLKERDVELMIEPGRFIAAPAVRLETEIINIYDDNIIVNASVFQGAMDTFIANVRLLVEGEQEEGKAYTIKGITPDSLDIFRYKVYLLDPKIGDTLTFLNAGAYTFRTDFCGLSKIDTLIVDSFNSSFN